MLTLARTGFRREQHFTTTKGTRFKGVLSPTNEQTLQSLTFISLRHLLRTRRDEPVKARDEFMDAFGRMFLLAEDDLRPSGKTFVCFELQKLCKWERVGAPTVDPVTKQPRAGSMQNLGQIWCCFEPMNATRDGGVSVMIDRERVITGADIRLGDRIDGRTVKELMVANGVSVGEVE